MARVLFIEPFYGGSHRAFADGLVARSAHSIRLLTLPGGEWRRRMRSGAQELARDSSAIDGEFDLIIATDMLDLPTFLALTRPRFDRTPVLAYFHENQFTYPRIRGTKLNSWFGQINYLSALAADYVAFNSAFHGDDFLAALRSIANQPNNWLMESAIPEIEAKSSVLPVGVDLTRFDGHRTESDGGPPIILWNHRWEFDKAPELFIRALERLTAEGFDFRVAIAGEPGDNPAPALVEPSPAIRERLVAHGYLESADDYAKLLWRSRIAVSTSRQEFFGIAAIEAMYCECLPVLPRRLNYPALVPSGWETRCLWDSENAFLALLRSALTSSRGDLTPLRSVAAGYDWATIIEEWDSAIARFAGIS